MRGEGHFSFRSPAGTPFIDGRCFWLWLWPVRAGSEVGRGGRGEIGEINGKETGVTIAQSLVRWRCSEVPISGHSGVPFFNFFF